jgi:hypothetical protein
VPNTPTLSARGGGGRDSASQGDNECGTSSTDVTFRSEQNEWGPDAPSRRRNLEAKSRPPLVRADREWRHRSVGQPDPPVNRMPRRRRVNESPRTLPVARPALRTDRSSFYPRRRRSRIGTPALPCRPQRWVFDDGGGGGSWRGGDSASQLLDARSFLLPLRRHRPLSARARHTTSRPSPARLPAGDPARRAGDFPTCRIPYCPYSCCCWFQSAVAHARPSYLEHPRAEGRRSGGASLGEWPEEANGRAAPLRPGTRRVIRISAAAPPSPPLNPGRIGLVWAGPPRLPRVRVEVHNPLASNPPWLGQRPGQGDRRGGLAQGPENGGLCVANLPPPLRSAAGIRVRTALDGGGGGKPSICAVDVRRQLAGRDEDRGAPTC